MATVPIQVTLDTTQNPPVILKDSSGNSARSVTASSGDTIKWQKHDNNDKFNISSLSPTGAGEAFSAPAPGGSGQWLSSDFTPPSSDPSGTEYPYTLTVTAENGTSYTTTQTEAAPDNNRPVIRN
jgi:hypothetical protein